MSHKPTPGNAAPQIQEVALRRMIGVLEEQLESTPRAATAMAATLERSLGAARALLAQIVSPPGEPSR